MTDINQIPLELAEQEFERWADAMDIELDTSFLDAEDTAAFEKNKRRLLRAMMRGALVISQDGEAVYTPQRTKDVEPLTFHERTGASLMAMDGKKKTQDAAKTYAIMATLCHVSAATFAKMKGEDIKVCEAIFVFLMD